MFLIWNLKCDTWAYEYTLAEWDYPCVNFLTFDVSSSEMQGNSIMQIKMDFYTLTRIWRQLNNIMFHSAVTAE